MLTHNSTVLQIYLWKPISWSFAALEQASVNISTIRPTPTNNNTTTTASYTISSVVPGDFNYDGKLDVLVMYSDTNDTLLTYPSCFMSCIYPLLTSPSSPRVISFLYLTNLHSQLLWCGNLWINMLDIWCCTSGTSRHWVHRRSRPLYQVWGRCWSMTLITTSCSTSLVKFPIPTTPPAGLWLGVRFGTMMVAGTLRCNFRAPICRWSPPLTQTRL